MQNSTARASCRPSDLIAIFFRHPAPTFAYAVPGCVILAAFPAGDFSAKSFPILFLQLHRPDAKNLTTWSQIVFIAGMKKISVKCPCCQGRGERTLSKPLLQTLKVIRWSHPCTTSEIFQRLQTPKLDRSAVNQRVKKLIKLGLVKATKEPGELRQYSPA